MARRGAEFGPADHDLMVKIATEDAAGEKFDWAKGQPQMTAGPETPTEQPGWSAARVTILIVALCILIAGCRVSRRSLSQPPA